VYVIKSDQNGFYIFSQNNTNGAKNENLLSAQNLYKNCTASLAKTEISISSKKRCIILPEDDIDCSSYQNDRLSVFSPIINTTADALSQVALR